MESALQAITDLERLERMSERVLDAADWQDLSGDALKRSVIFPRFDGPGVPGHDTLSRPVIPRILPPSASRPS